MSTTVYEVLDQLRGMATSEHDKGSMLERLLLQYLRTDPLWTEQFDDVWLWQDWPGRQGRPDTGIDLVAKDALTGGMVAIQSKFYAPGTTVSKPDVDTFLSASGGSAFKRRIIVSTTDKWNSHARSTIEDQAVPVTVIGLPDLEAADLDWDSFTWDRPDQLPTKSDDKPLRPYQREAIAAVTEGLQAHDRGKLIMACGTGKTFTSLRLAEQIAGPGTTVLFLVPSISLLSQTLREWSAAAEVPLAPIAVCSDTKATARSGATSEDIRASDLALPSTTNTDELINRIRSAQAKTDRMTVVFSTYQSIDVIHRAQKAGDLAPFDLVICDEAHRTTGAKIAGADESPFMRVHDDTYLKAIKRLYMTATPRIFGSDARSKADDHAAVIASMDDETLYGPELYRIGFGKAVEQGYLTDYRVLILTVDEKYVASNFQTELAQDGEIQLGDAARIIGCWNGLAKHFDTTTGESLTPMKRAVAFAPNIKTSKAIATAFPTVVDQHIETLDAPVGTEDNTEAEDVAASMDLRVECRHVDGTFNALARNTALDWLKAEPEPNTCRILTNARCLSEGIDVPALDAVMFLSPRGSEVDVVQSVGRVMRTAKGKDYGYIILPIAIPTGMSPEAALSDNAKYAGVWKVLRALRSHDDRFEATINKLDLNRDKRNDKIGIGHIDGDGNLTGVDDATEQAMLDLDFGGYRDAIYAKIVEKVGERRYWETWAKDVAGIAQQHITRITALLDNPASGVQPEFDRFLTGLRGNLNDNITRDDAVEMLAQHLITRPVFDALFGGYDFAAHNPVAQTMERMLEALDEHSLDTENSSLEGFYASVRSRVEGIDNAEGRQKIMVELYDKFFATAFKRTVDKLGIVYTPTEVVDFILRSADAVLRKHFGQGLTDEGVHVLDGFTGTGTFVARLLSLGLIEPKDLVRKYRHELHANEILLLAYYIAAVNIETTFQDQKAGTLDDPGEYQPFPGLILTDTFQSWENDDRLDTTVFVQNNERLEHLKKLDITVLVGNPPYSVGQRSANDASANEKYPDLDEAIRNSYGSASGVKLLRNLYDSYVRAIKWASMRIGERGVVAYVTNGGWLENNAFAQMRRSLSTEFSDIYIYNLKGNMRATDWKREGGQIFGAGSQATVAITILIKSPGNAGPAKIHYSMVGDYLTREQKLTTVARAIDITHVPTTAVTPNQYGDWLDQRSVSFEAFIPLKGGIFQDFAPGTSTSRDPWVYASSRENLRESVERMVSTFNRLVDEGHRDRSAELDKRKISWSDGLENELRRGRHLPPDDKPPRVAVYRPFFKQWVSANQSLHERPGAVKFFREGVATQALYVSGPSATSDSSILVVDAIPNFHTLSTGQCFPRWVNAPVAPQELEGLLAFDEVDDGGRAIDGHVRVDAITDGALARFRAAYGQRLTKDDIFDYCYGLLHSQDYRATYAADLKKVLPRIPLVTDPWPYVEAGRELAKLHLDYETVEPYPLEGLDAQPSGAVAWEFYRVEKMAFAKQRDPETKKLVADKSTIKYNGHITVSGMPEDAYRYMLGSRSAVEWIMDRYQVKTDKASGIVNDPNDWSHEVDDPRYILDLLARIVTVSVETMKIVDALPPLDILPTDARKGPAS
ncbi:DEAD/DEAH box helicase [Arsenicicoccus sp. UBA7492]|uniref:DEAD/DEAH box helicase n=1 Tax=Arsenicicoccus sp. UBA7492 TaxID=1946057 RepID=UPI00257DE2E5|nr:type ISP restriction/modification enzyme [Arsenicicoccus sp. UBA7492]